MAKTPKVVSKSPHFDDNMNGKRMSNQAKKNVFKIASIVYSRSEIYIPVASGRLRATNKIKNVGKNIVLSSLNYSDTAGSGIDRYNYVKPNKTYRLKSGVIIKAGKNAGKNKWYHRAANDTKKQTAVKSKEDVLL